MKNNYILIITITILISSLKLYSELTLIADSLELRYNEKLDLGSSILIRDIDSFDANNCIITGNYHNIGGCIIKTSDGGESWHNVFIDDFSLSYGEDTTNKDKDYVLHHGDFIDKNLIISPDLFARKFFKTTNNGLTWDTIPGSIHDTLVYIDKFKMFDENYGYFTTDNYMLSKEYIETLYYTEDGCKSWNRININLDFVDNDQFWPIFIDAKIINGKSYMFYRLIYKKNSLRHESRLVIYDFNTHEQEKIDLPKYTRDFYFFSENEGIAVGSILEPIKFNIDTAIIHKTYDGGKSWEVIYKGDQNFKEAVFLHYFSPDMIGVTGRGKRLLISNNRGLDWKNIADTNDIAPVVNPVSIASDKVIYYMAGNKFYKWVDGETSVVELPKINEFKIYPNPVQDYILINPPQSPFGKGGSEFASRGISEIVIYDVLGEKVMNLSSAGGGGNEVAGGGQIKINVSNLPTGMYFIKIGDRVEKFVKE